MSLEVRIDRDRCMGSGNCVFWAPQAFALEDDGIAVLLEPSEVELEQVLQAREGCPTGAISVRVDGQDAREGTRPRLSGGVV